MALAIPRPVLLGITLVGLVAHVGCASHSLHVAAEKPRSPGTPSTSRTVDECEAFARAEVGALAQRSATGAFVHTLGEGGIAALRLPLIGLAILPIAIVAAPFEAASVTKENQRRREAALESALRRCREPSTLEATLGADHPDVARSLYVLAERHAALGLDHHAETLHRRALGIREHALPDRHPDVAASLDAYAALLRKTGRNGEAEALEARARVIHEDEEGQARATGNLAAFARTLSERGAVQAAAGDYTSAERAFQRVLGLAETDSVVDREDVLRTLNRYIQLLMQTGRAGEAAQITAHAEALRRPPAEGEGTP
jgi:tetratricopeptide (TPR) repeat protein